MDEYIKRKDAFDILQSRLDNISQMSYLDMDWHELDIMRNAIENAIDDIGEVPPSDVQPVNRWISVKDRLPEAGVNVLVTDGMHMMVTWCEYVDNQCLWVDNFYEYVNVRFKEVTHWMPLPEFPKN